MNVLVSPAKKITGRLRLPGDKSISHRLAMLGAIAEGKSTVSNFAQSQDCLSTLTCLRELGAQIEVLDSGDIAILGQGLHGLKKPLTELDAGNSGTTIRLLSGILSGQNFVTQISGDDSLQRRPMKRIISPLTLMGATIEARNNDFPPLRIAGGPLRSIVYKMPVASAQVKSAILMAALYASGVSQVTEPSPTRNHTELALLQFGINLDIDQNTISLQGGQALEGRDFEVPGDISSAAFFIVAASMLAGSELVLEGIGLNPGRRGMLDWLAERGASIQVIDERVRSGELVGDLVVKSAPIAGGHINGPTIPLLIDEIPILAVLATQTEGGLEIRDAGELRVKESDRISSIVENLRKMGATVEEFQDGMFIPGRQSLKGSSISAHGDHRIAMAFAIAALSAQGDSEIEGAEAVAISFPGFFETLNHLAVR